MCEGREPYSCYVMRSAREAGLRAFGSCGESARGCRAGGSACGGDEAWLAAGCVPQSGPPTADRAAPRMLTVSTGLQYLA